MFLQEGPADTFNFMVFGFIVILGSMVLYVTSLFTRMRNLKRDEEMLKELEETGTIFHDD